MQQNFVSRFVLFQGYALGLVTVLRAATSIYEFDTQGKIIYRDDHDFDSRGPAWWVLPAQLSWITAGLLLLWGIYRRNVRLLYPMVVVAGLLLVAKLIREVTMHWQQGNIDWNAMTFLFPMRLVALVVKTIYGMMTILALRKLFETEQRIVHSFVRFEAENESCERIEPEQ